jgi:hypothetical protein
VIAAIGGPDLRIAVRIAQGTLNIRSTVVPQAKYLSKRKRSSKVAPMLGAAGWLTLASGASADRVVDTPTQNAGAIRQVFLGEEEIADVSLATFYVLDKENLRTFRPGLRFAVGAGGGCWTGTYYTSSGSGNDTSSPSRPARPLRSHASKRAPKN